MNMIYFAAIREGAHIPQKRDEDAGYDIYPCFDEPFMKIEPHSTVIIPSGIISAFPKEYVAILKERGSTGTRGIGQRAGVIDSGYRGEWLISTTNHNDKPLIIAKKECIDQFDKDANIIYPYEKAICQAVFIPLAQLEAAEVTPDEILAISSDRGSGKLGSSGK